MRLTILGTTQRAVALLINFRTVSAAKPNIKGHTKRDTASVTTLAVNHKRKSKTRTAATNARAVPAV